MDPLTLEVVRHALGGIAEEMGVVLRRTARSPNITEREDCSCALATPAGEMCAQAEHIPVHLGAMPASIASAIARFPALEEGDAVLVNDPFAGGTHLNDLTLVSPVFLGPRLLGFVANRAHHADVGGKSPGSMPGDSTEVFQEGVRIPPVLAWRRGRPVEAILGIVVANSRAPAERLGDLRSQAGANAAGAERLRALASRIGADGLAGAMEALIDYTERATRAGIAALPDGEWRFEDVLDSDGAGSGPVRIVATVRIRGEEMEVDFTGSDAQQRGNVNAVLPVTVSCVTFVVRCLTGPEVPPTAGAMRPVRVIAPEGTVVNARPPAAVSAGNVECSQRIVDAVLGALAQALPGRIPAASQGTMNNLLVGTPTFAYYETVGGGQGGSPVAAGMHGVQTGMTNTKNTPAEAVEYAYPLRVLRYELREGTGGRGLHAGGMGLRRDVEVRCDAATVSLQTDRRRSAPWGLAGGEAGAPGRNLLIRGGEELELPDKCTVETVRGEVISMQTPGGGGWGAEGRTALPAGSSGSAARSGAGPRAFVSVRKEGAMFKEFKAFALRGNVVDLAIGVMIGVAFNAVVQSLVNDVLMNLVSAVAGKPNFNRLAIDAGRADVLYGAFLTQVVNFLIVAFTLFLIVKTMNRLGRPKEEPDNAPETRECPRCLTSIPAKASRCSACTSEVEPQAA